MQTRSRQTSRLSRVNAATLLLLPVMALISSSNLPGADGEAAPKSLFDKSNLVAWCIVPFDTKKRGPEERAQMLEKLGLGMLAYDWRDEHIPTFDTEVETMKKHGIEMLAWWFPSSLNDKSRAILDCIKRNGIHPQLWVSAEGGRHLRLDQAFESTPEAQQAHVRRIADKIKPIAAEAASLGCQVALYNHGGWAGVPENQIAVIELLKQEGVDNVGMVYTQHHGHGEIDRFAEIFPKMKPYLLAVTLNGMIKDGDLQGQGTVPIGQGDQDLRLLGIIKESGWQGPVGIILEVKADAELRLQDNLAGLAWVDAQLTGGPAGPKPVPQSWKNESTPASYVDSESPAFGKALQGGLVQKGNDAYRTRPLTVECRVKLNSSDKFNILLANGPKSSPEHWELYTVAKSGALAVYQPAGGGDFRSELNICDGKWHTVGAILGEKEVRLSVDGTEVLRASAPPIEAKGSDPAAPLAIGRLVEKPDPCDGAIDEVRISKGERSVSKPPEPLTKDGSTIGLWNFDHAE